MSYSRDHAIVVSSWCNKSIDKAHAKAIDLGLGDVVSNIVARRMNGGASFAVLPDGSNEGWEDSNEFDAARAKFVEWIQTTYYPDGSSRLKWVEVQFGDDDRECKVLGSSDDDDRALEP